MTRADVRITDSDYRDAVTILTTYIDALINTASSYVAIMNKVRDEAIDDGMGKVASKCQEKAGLMQIGVYEPLVSLKSSLTSQTGSFLSAIDELDFFIYKER